MTLRLPARNAQEQVQECIERERGLAWPRTDEGMGLMASVEPLPHNAHTNGKQTGVNQHRPRRRINKAIYPYLGPNTPHQVIQGDVGPAKGQILGGQSPFILLL